MGTSVPEPELTVRRAETQAPAAAAAEVHLLARHAAVLAVPLLAHGDQR